jgi:phasin family protein
MVEPFESFPGLSRLLNNVDHTKMVEEFTKLLTQLKVPGVDMDALVASHRENLEALTTANKAAVEAVQFVGNLQMKILQEAMTDLSRANDALALATAGSPQEVAVKQAEMAGNAFKTALTNMLELAEIVTEANQKATNAIVTRIPQSLDEIQDVLKLRS